ncbi:hypothetical protein AFNJKBDN_CDS0008 [Halorubrum virus V_ICIS4]|nr:hypothetical protein AFNJKBDN_CDS0008 [Halorubrum virus V_ICIS4]
MTPALGCESTLAGYCLSVAPVNVIMATLLFAAAAILFDRWRLEVRSDA